MEIKNIAKAFIAAQKAMGNASKDSKNPFFKSKYADLNSVREACLPALNENGIAVLQPIIQIEGKSFVKTVLLHESGETLESLTAIIYAKQNDAQAQGSGITYARRYGLQSLVSIGADDDDGNGASKTEVKPHLKLSNVVNDEEIKKLREEERVRKNEEKRLKAENWFAKVKTEFEGEFGSLEEVEGLEDGYTKEIKALEKHKDLHELLTNSIKVAKLQFKEEFNQ